MSRTFCCSKTVLVNREALSANWCGLLEMKKGVITGAVKFLVYVHLDTNQIITFSFCNHNSMKNLSYIIPPPPVGYLSSDTSEDPCEIL